MSIAITSIGIFNSLKLSQGTKKLTAFSIYPNPSQNGYLNISNNEIIQHIKIYNNLGKQVYSGSNFDKSSLAIKITGYGIHFVQLSDSQKTITKKVVLN